MNPSSQLTAEMKKVPVVYPAHRCSAPGCGDKIKDDDVGWCWEDAYGQHYHSACCDEDGKPLPLEL